MSRMPDVGDVVDDVFRVESELDHGNFGAIYRVHDIVEDRTLALKIQKPGPHDEKEVRQRFEREARLIYSLDHGHVVEVMYYGETGNGLPYMAMEFLDGTDLKRLLRGGFELNDDQIKRISLETLSALDAAHHIGIVHRDLKPANIFLVDDGDRGHVKVLDFGFAKAKDDQNNRELTRAGTLVGSPAYMAPELVHKQEVGPHSDLYGMGLIMAEMITGEKVVQIENIYDTIVFQGSDKPVDLPPEVSRSPFSDVIKRAVHKDVRQRYKSAEEMMDDLRKIGRDETSADLQSHAEVDTETSAPWSSALPEEEVETEPRAGALPSEERVDQQLRGGDESGHPEETNRQTSGPHQAVDQRAQTPNPRRESGGMEPIESSEQRNSGRISTAPVEAVDQSDEQQTERRSTAPAPAVEGRDSGVQETIDRQRPPSRRNRDGGSSLFAEIMLGVLLGSVGVALILFVLVYM